MVTRFGTDTSPSSGSSSPTTMRNNVVLPAPFGPTRPTFSPGLSWNEASTNTSCLPYCLLILENEIICFQPTRMPTGCVTASQHERAAVFLVRNESQKKWPRDFAAFSVGKILERFTGGPSFSCHPFSSLL